MKSKKIEKEIEQRTGPLRLRILIAIAFFIALIVAGSFVYKKLEGWSFIDSLYFTTMTITTVGYGDLTPTQPISKLFTVFYCITGIAIAFYILFLIGRYLVEHWVFNLKQELIQLSPVRWFNLLRKQFDNKKLKTK